MRYVALPAGRADLLKNTGFRSGGASGIKAATAGGLLLLQLLLLLLLLLLLELCFLCLLPFLSFWCFLSLLFVLDADGAIASTCQNILPNLGIVERAAVIYDY
jgi:hypothetical protein